MLRVENLSWSYGERTLFKKISFELKGGECVLLSGGNGAGKSTLLKLIHKRLIPLVGYITVFSRDIRTISRTELERICPMVDQIPLIVPEATIAENLIGLENEGKIEWMYLFSSKRRSICEIDNEYEKLAELVGLDPGLNYLAKNLSYGQQKLLTIIRALWPSTSYCQKIILLDEPLAGVGKENCVKVLNALDRRRSEGWGIVMVEHSPVAKEFADFEIPIEQYAE